MFTVWLFLISISAYTEKNMKVCILASKPNLLVRSTLLKCVFCSSIGLLSEDYKIIFYFIQTVCFKVNTYKLRILLATMDLEMNE